MASYKGKFRDHHVSGFPTRRVQELLHQDCYSGLGGPVLAEGAFIQFSANGRPCRQVYLAITNQEFILVTQEPSRYQAESETVMSLAVDGLAVNSAFPLPLLRFFVLDDRAKRFVVCTCTEAMLYFEMCQFDALTESLWAEWREKMFESSVDNRNYYGYTIWTNKMMAKRKHWKHFNPHGLAEEKYLHTKSRIARFVHHPYPFCEVRSVGCQTTQVNDFSARTAVSTTRAPRCRTEVSRRIAATCWANPDSNEAVAMRRLAIFDGGYRLVNQTLKNPVDDNCSRTRISPRRSSSLPDVNYDNVDVHPDTETDKAVIAELSGCMYYCYQSGLPQRIISSIKKLARRRQKRDQSDIIRALDYESSDSEETLDDLMVELSTETDNASQDSRAAVKEKWRRAASAVLGQRKRNVAHVQFENTVQQVIFRMCKPSQTKPTSLSDVSPGDVATEMTDVSRALFLNIKCRDVIAFHESKGGVIPPSIQAILKLGDDIRTLVASEILRCNDVANRVNVLKFYIQVCLDLLLKHHDFQSFVSVYRGLVSLPIYRLHGTWSALSACDPHYICYIVSMGKVLSPEKGFASYVHRLDNCVSKKVPVITWVEHLLAHCCVHTTYNGDIECCQNTIVKRSTNAASKHSFHCRKNTSTKRNLKYERTEQLKEKQHGKLKLKSILKSSKTRKSRKLFLFFDRKRSHGVTFCTDENGIESSMCTQRLSRKKRDIANDKAVTKTQDRSSGFTLDREQLHSQDGYTNSEQQIRRNKYRRSTAYPTAIDKDIKMLSKDTPETRSHINKLDAYCHSVANAILRSALVQLQTDINLRKVTLRVDGKAEPNKSIDDAGSDSSSECDSSSTEDENVSDTIPDVGTYKQNTSPTQTLIATQNTGLTPTYIGKRLVRREIDDQPQHVDVKVNSDSQSKEKLATDAFGNAIPKSFYQKQLEAAQRRSHIFRHAQNALTVTHSKDQSIQPNLPKKQEEKPRKMSIMQQRISNRRKSLFEQAMDAKDKELKPEGTEFDKSMKLKLSRMKSTILEFDENLDKPLIDIQRNTEVGMTSATAENVNRDKERKISKYKNKVSSIVHNRNQSSHSNAVKDVVPDKNRPNDEKKTKVRNYIFPLKDILHKRATNTSRNALKQCLRMPKKCDSKVPEAILLRSPTTLYTEDSMDWNSNSEVTKLKRKVINVFRSSSNEQICFGIHTVDRSSACMLCGMGRCTYNSSIWKQVIDFQLQVASLRVESKRRVRELLKNAISSLDRLSEYDLFRTSLRLE